MRAIDIEEFEAAHAGCVAALREATDRDWSVRAGSLVWPATLTAAHLTDVLYSYAFQAAAHGTAGDLPFLELQAAPAAQPAGLVDGIHATGVMLASVLRGMPAGATSQWWGRPVGAQEWAAMGAHETLLHSYDIARGLELPLEPARDVVAHLYAHWHADTPLTGDDAWAALVRASGRPFGDEEWDAWRAEVEARRARPAPRGSEDGVISDFADGEPTSRFGNGWVAMTDERLGGKSSGTLEVVVAEAPTATHALRASGTLVASDAPLTFGGVRFHAGAARGEVANLTAHEGVRFWARGADGVLDVWSLTPAGFGGRHVVPLSQHWAQFRLPFHWFGTDGSDLTGLLFAVDNGEGDYWFELTDIGLF